jgi:NADH:ubiquinone oxidoreductase subunit 6 (subunit J)
MSAAGEEHSADPTGRPLRLLVATLVGAEAVLLLFAAAFLVWRAATTSEESPAELISLAAVAVVVGAGLALCARGVLAGLSWTRGPVLTWQLLQAAVGAPLSSTGSWWAGVPLLSAAVVVGVLIAGRQVIPRPADRF